MDCRHCFSSPPLRVIEMLLIDKFTRVPSSRRLKSCGATRALFAQNGAEAGITGTALPRGGSTTKGLVGRHPVHEAELCNAMG
jgi:hypothetical protein